MPAPKLPATLAALALALGVLLASNPAHAFKINPGAVSETSIKKRHQGWLADIAAPVHERMALLSRECALAQPDGVPCDTRAPLRRALLPGRIDPLILGARWPDDPNNQFPGNYSLMWVFWMSDAQAKARIEPVHPLLYRSHFGDLQLLHAMAEGKTTPGTARKAVLEWLAFAFDVASGQIPLTARLGELEGSHGFAWHFAQTRKRQWTVRRLFTNVNDYKGGQLPDLSDDDVRQIAMGALLHTVQDSFARAHTLRDAAYENDPVLAGAVITFMNYRDQKAHCHSAQDREPEWLEEAPNRAMTPVDHGAWIMRRANEGASWDTVRHYLLLNVFPFSDKMHDTDGGPYGNC